MVQVPNLTNVPKTRLVVLAIIAVVLVGGIYLFTRGPEQGPAPVTLTMWGTDPKSAWEGVFKAYASARPYVTIEYSEVSADRYNKDLVKAFATGKGPDIFTIGNHDLLKQKDFLAPAGERFTVSQVTNAFPRAAVQDLTLENQVYALPLSMDTLVLFYNHDLLDRAGIAAAPKTWEEFLTAVEALTKQNAQNQVVQSGAALGASEPSVAYATDILSALMLQNGVEPADSDGRPQFASEKGAQALEFYTAFADPGSSRYAWSAEGSPSLESFLSGKTAMAFGYKEDADRFEKKSPFLRFGIAPLPQTSLDAPVNVAAYRALAVWARSPQQSEAWNFTLYATTNANASRTYLAATGKAPALRKIIGEAKDHPDLGFLASQALTARSWLVADYASMKEIWNDAIREVLRGSSSAPEALRRAEDRMRRLTSE